MGGDFGGRPRGCSVVCKCNRFAVRSCHAPRQMECRAIPNAVTPPTPPRFAPIARAAANLRAAPAAPRRQPLPSPRTRCQRLDHRQSSAALHEIRPQRVAFHIPHHRQQVIVLLDRKRLEAALVQRTGSSRAMRSVPALRMRDRHPSHELRQFSIPAGPKHKVPMVGKQAPSQDPHRHALLRLGQHLLEGFIIPLLGKIAIVPRPDLRHGTHIRRRTIAIFVAWLEFTLHNQCRQEKTPDPFILPEFLRYI